MNSIPAIRRLRPRFLVAATLLFPGTLPAQETALRQVETDPTNHVHGGCRTSPGPGEVPLIRELGRQGLHRLENPPELVFQVPMTFHIVRRTDGTGGPTTAALDGDIPVLNAAFLPAGMQFFRAGPVDFINNDFFFNQIAIQADADALRLLNNVPNTVNVYFVDDFSILLTILCGQSTFTTSGFPQGIIMDSDCMPNTGNPSTFPHEFGHYFDLYHTHEPIFGLECPDGSNCFVAGDLLCDTPADPNLMGQVDASCSYTGSAMRCGLAFNPQVANIMSVAPPFCRTLFTPQQYLRATATLVNLRSNLLGSQAVVSWVDWSHGGPEFGSFGFPWSTLSAALAVASNGSRIVIKTGSDPETLLMDQDVLIDSFRGPAVIGQ